jgi:NAD(P)H-hydrate epimerase
MKSVSAADVRRMDEKAALEFGMPGLLLMENAGRSVADVICRDFDPCRVLIVAGKGNNGGDGLVAARHLATRGFSPQVILLEDPALLKSDPLLNLNIVRRMNVPLFCVTAVSEDELAGYFQDAGLIVDAIFGVGIHSPVRGIFENAIRAINQSRKKVVSVDVPSGLDADTGAVRGAAVMATRTLTLALPKAGLLKGEGPKYAGEIEIVDIGLPRALLQSFLD